MGWGVPPLMATLSVAPASTVPVNVGVVSLVNPPLAIAPTVFTTSSSTFVITGAFGATVSTVRAKAVSGLRLPAKSMTTNENV